MAEANHDDGLNEEEYLQEDVLGDDGVEEGGWRQVRGYSHQHQQDHQAQYGQSWQWS